ncbi:MAG: beta-N-acetylhexosaminidase [Pseudomonadota bacterium]
MLGCITSVSGPVLLAQERAFLREANPWGVILMGRSCQSRSQVQRLVSDIQEALGRAALIFIDQEGGRVARLKPPEWPAFPAAAHYGALYSQDAEAGLEACYLGHRLMADRLSDLGIHADCAPVCDLRQAETHDAIGDRAFADSVEAAATLGRVALEGLAAGGVVGCLKHMPGQGRAQLDSHLDLPQIEASLAALDQDFSVFAALSDQALMGMTGHVAYDALAPGEAATVSKTVISNVIRGRIGFDGLLMTDDLGMQALGGDLRTRGERALAAGCDVLLHCSGFLSAPDAILSEMQAIAEAAKPLQGIALYRAQRAQAGIGQPLPFDRAAAQAQLDQLMQSERI